MYNFYRAQTLTLIYCWAFALIFVFLGGSLYTPFFFGFFLIYCWIPALIAFQFYHHEQKRIPLSFKWKPIYLNPILLSTALFLFNLILILPFSTIRSLDILQCYFYSFFSHLTPFTVIFLLSVLIAALALVVGSTAYLLVHLGSEIMWRGYTWDKIKGLGFWKASLISGLMVGLWKAPLVLMGFNYPLHPYMGMLWQVLFSMSMAPLALYYRLKTQSILGAAFFVSIYFAYTDFIPMLFDSSRSLWTGSLGFVDMIAFNVFNVLLSIKIRKHPLLEYEV